jgi:hypothetical protein
LSVAGDPGVPDAPEVDGKEDEYFKDIFWSFIYDLFSMLPTSKVTATVVTSVRLKCSTQTTQGTRFREGEKKERNCGPVRSCSLYQSWHYFNAMLLNMVE